MQPLIPIIIAAGKCSRFYPYANEAAHKSMVLLAGKPLLRYAIDGLRQSGFKEIVIVVNVNDKKIRKYFSDGKNLGIKINYAIQKEPKGMGDALLCAKDYIKGDFLLLNANQINISEFLHGLLAIKNQKKCAGVLLGKKEPAGAKYGIFELDKNRALKITEKPKAVRNVGIAGGVGGNKSVRVVGIYLLDKNFIAVLEKTKRNENSLEEALNKYFLESDVRVLITEKETFSLKYPWDLFKIKNYILNNLPRYISKKALIKKGVFIEGNVYIEEGAVVYENAVIKGPCYIGKDAVIGNFTLIRSGCDIGDNVVIGCGADVKNAIFMKKSSMHSGFVGDSIIGENSHLGAGFITANKRFDDQNIKVLIKNEKIDSGLNRLGAFIGSNANVGVQSSIMPGVIIGNNAVIYPGKKIFKNTSENALIKKA